MAINERAKYITDLVYAAYGTDSGCLFGLSPSTRSAVEAIVRVVLDLTERETCDEKDD